MADVGFKGVFAPGRRFLVVEGTVKIVDGRSAMTTAEVYGGARMLADANMKRDLEVKDLETSETRWAENSRAPMMESKEGDITFTSSTLLVQPLNACLSLVL